MNARRHESGIRRFVASLLLASSVIISGAARADGTEMLGPTSIALAEATFAKAAGTGMVTQPGTIEISIPAGADIRQVLLYWEGFHFFENGGDATINVNGKPVTGTRIGGPNPVRKVIDPADGKNKQIYSSTFRAGIFALREVAAGDNTLVLTGMNFSWVNNGAGVVVTWKDGTTAPSTVDLRDGNDFAWANAADASRRTTEPLTFQFDAAAVERDATLAMFFSSVKGQASHGGDRPTVIEVTFDVGDPVVFINELSSNDGEEWDTLNLLVAVPAGATSATVQALSEDRTASGNEPASFFWNVALFSIPPGGDEELIALGDRVWEDLDRDGVQDCADTNNNGIVGDAGDIGDECGKGVADVTVSLYSGADCSVPVGQSTLTDANGFYGFDGLQGDTYCVEFDLSTIPDDFCAADVPGQGLVNLGAPGFTLQNQTGDAVDSDANPATGLTDPLALTSDDLTFDAGIHCPVKLGDYVWEDTNKDGTQDASESPIENVGVELFECGPDGIPGNGDDVATGATRVTDANGFYTFGGESGFTLDPGRYYVRFGTVDGFTRTTQHLPGDDTVDSDCNVATGITQCTDLSVSRAVNLDRDCGYVPPPSEEEVCELVLDKTCEAGKPTVEICKGKLKEFTVRWMGGKKIWIKGLGYYLKEVADGESVTFKGPFDSSTQYLYIYYGHSWTKSIFSVGCSDSDFNSPDDIGKFAGNGTGSYGLNYWVLERYVDANNVAVDGNTTAAHPANQMCQLPEGKGPHKVTYGYKLTNNGTPLSAVTIVDDKLGTVGTAPGIATGETLHFTESAWLSEKTVNIANASASLASGASCSATDTVTVKAPICTVKGYVKYTDKNVAKFALTNTGASATTLYSLLLKYPSNYGKVTYVKIGSNTVYDYTKSSKTFNSGDTIGANDWTSTNPAHRLIQPGATVYVEVTVKSGYSWYSYGDWSATAVFAEGCEVTVKKDGNHYSRECPDRDGHYHYWDKD